MATLDAVVHSDPEILGGTPVFRGTRVPLKNLVDYLAAGDTLDAEIEHGVVAPPSNSVSRRK